MSTLQRLAFPWDCEYSHFIDTSFPVPLPQALTPSLSLRIGLLWTFPTHRIHTTGPWVSGVSHGASCVQGPPTLQPESEPPSCSWLHTIPLCVWVDHTLLGRQAANPACTVGTFSLPPIPRMRWWSVSRRRDTGSPEQQARATGPLLHSTGFDRPHTYATHAYITRLSSPRSPAELPLQSLRDNAPETGG